MASTSKSKRRRAKKPTRNWLELPPEVMASILHRVGAIDILHNVQRVCTTWRRICKDPSMWRVIDMHNLGDLNDMPYDLEEMCRHAVDRSEGQLVDINVEYFGTDELLQYIADRSSQLRRLRLVICHCISSEGLIEAVKKLPLLEELHLYHIYLDKEAIEAVGRCCLLLKSFKLNTEGFRHQYKSDKEALAIAENMPEIRHLQLFGNKMTNDGLQAILDGCRHLESLDLRQCFSVTLEGNLGKRCSEQIKDLRRPNDSTEGFGFDAKLRDRPYGLFGGSDSSSEEERPILAGTSVVSGAAYEDLVNLVAALKQKLQKVTSELWKFASRKRAERRLKRVEAE